MYAGFISPEGMAQLRLHKYAGSEYTELDKLLNAAVWEPLAERLPRNLAPNLITMGAFLTLALGCLVCVFAPETMLHRRPSLVLLFCALAGFVYQTLDAIDGKQARRLGVGSPLGQLFDHGCDCVGVTFWAYMLLSALGARRDPFAVFVALVVAVVFFYPAQFAEYFTGVLKTSSFGFGVTETQFLFIGAFLLAGVIGPGVFATRLGGSGLTLARALCCACAVAAIGLCVPFLKVSYDKADSKEQFFTMLAPICVFLALSAALFASAARRHTSALFFLCAFAFNALTMKMILSSITRMRYPLWHLEMLPMVAVLAVSWLRAGEKVAHTAVVAGALVNAGLLGLLAVGAVRQIARALGIPVFTVQAP